MDEKNSEMKIFEPREDTLKLARLDEDLHVEVQAHTDSEGHVHFDHDSQSY